MTDVEHNFDVRVAAADLEGYYWTNWGEATPMTVVAKTKQDAVNTACDLMGAPPRGRYWAVKTDKVYPVK